MGVGSSATEKSSQRGFLWPRRKLKSVRIRDAIVRRRRAVSIAALIVRDLATGRRLRATVITRNALPARRRVRRGKNRMADVVVGPVAGLWRYPVKSMQGEELDQVSANERGFLGDRAYALIDKDSGKVGSAKNPRRWPKLLDFRAVFREPPSPDRSPPAVRIDFPDGSRSVASDSPDVNDRLSHAFKRAVILSSAARESLSLEEYWPDIDGLAHRETVTDETIGMGAPPGTFFDFAAVHIVTTATLSSLSDAYPQGRFDWRRFRANIIAESNADGFPENDWVGRRILIGELTLEVLIPCARCVMTTLAQGDLPLDSGILRTAAQQDNVMIAPLGQAMPSVGVYAKVLTGGVVRRGDQLRVAS